MDTGSMIRRISKYQIVSFDIFDTLLKRDVYKPTDVFQVVQQEAKEKYNIDSDFKRVRIEAERKAREKSSFSEINLDEIYEEIEIQDKDKLKALELEVESRILHCNYNIKPIYDACLAARKDVYIISDMYLPTSFLKSLLTREGFVGYKALILSAEYRKTKRSGDLFNFFLDTFNIKSSEVIHIGDSWYADYIGPRKVKIAGIHIPRVEKNTLYTPVPDDKSIFEKRTLFAFINSRVGKFGSRDEKLGYEVLGPILFSYCKWIHDQYVKIRNEQSEIWFAARDMYLFRQAYEIIYGSSEIDYMYISRRSLRPILTYTTGDITESGKAFSRGTYTIGKIVQKMGYDINDLADEGFDNEVKYNIRKLGEYPEVRRLLSSSSILNKEREQAEIGVRYLESKGLFDSDIILTDVGWHGTTQYILTKIQESVSKKGKLFGLYLGCLDSTNERIGKENYNVFAFSEDVYSDFAKGILLFEALILAPHGSTIRYRYDGNEVVPELGAPENVSEYLLNVQKGAMDFVEAFKESVLWKHVELDATTATCAFCTLAMSPLRGELKNIGNLDYDDFGMGKVAAPKSIRTYILHPQMLYHDLKHSPWRIGFLYRLFKVRLPYGKIYSILRGMDEEDDMITIEYSDFRERHRGMIPPSALGVA